MSSKTITVEATGHANAEEIMRYSAFGESLGRPAERREEKRECEECVTHEDRRANRGPSRPQKILGFILKAVGNSEGF